MKNEHQKLPPLAGNSAAFTLIELLTVIAIIGILAAILIPVAGRVRDSAKQAQCTSNLRQIGQGYLMYAGEHEDRFPPSSGAGGYWEITYLAVDMLGPYTDLQDFEEVDSGGPGGAVQVRLGENSVWRCPAGPEIWRYHYLPNHFSWGLYYPDLDPASRFVLLWDRGGGPDPTTAGSTPNSPRTPGWHGGKFNAVYGDGHVGLLTHPELIQNLRRPDDILR